MVKDSAIFTKSMRLEEHMKIEGNLSVYGEANFLAPIYMSNFTAIDTASYYATSYGFSIVDPNSGKMDVINKNNFLSTLINDMYLPDCGKYGSAPIPNPHWANGTNKVFLECDQINVGIGTNNPLYNLDVRGDAYVHTNMGIAAQPNPNAQLNIYTNEQVGVVVDYNHAQDWGYAYKTIVRDDETKAFGVFNDILGKDVFRVMGNGTVWAAEIYVDNVDDFPDYVFEKHYKLLTFEDLRKYIAQKKHLPNIPTAVEIAENGMNVSELQRLQMEKIEELTLYILQLEKRVKEVEHQLSNQ